MISSPSFTSILNSLLSASKLAQIVLLRILTDQSQVIISTQKSQDAPLALTQRSLRLKICTLYLVTLYLYLTQSAWLGVSAESTTFALSLQAKPAELERRSLRIKWWNHEWCGKAVTGSLLTSEWMDTERGSWKELFLDAFARNKIIRENLRNPWSKLKRKEI